MCVCLQVCVFAGVCVCGGVCLQVCVFVGVCVCGGVCWQVCVFVGVCLPGYPPPVLRQRLDQDLTLSLFCSLLSHT